MPDSPEPIIQSAAYPRTALSNRWLVPLGLLLLCIIGYAPLIATLGLYWDDWPSLWFLHFFGPGIFPHAFAADRPVQGWLFTLTTSLIGESLVAWHIFGILARWMSGLSLFWLLISLWPEHKLQVTSVTALFLLYPGFMQQYIPITYGHQFLIMSLFFLSLTLMVWSIRKPRWYWIMTVFSLLSGILTMFSLEYYFGLELLRPVILWLLAGQTPDFRARLWNTFKRWLLYIITDMGFLYFRLTHSTPRGEVTLFKNLARDPTNTISILIKTISTDMYESAIVAWGRMFAYLNVSAMKLNLVLAYAAIVIASGLVAFVLFLLIRRGQEQNSASGKGHTSRKTVWGLQAILVGVFALLIAGWPIWVTDLRLELSVPWDRFTQPFMLGACLVLVGVLDFVLRPSLPRLAVISLLVGLAAGAQFHYAFAYRLDWTAQKRFFWQLAWRVPAIQPGTLLLTAASPFFITSDNSLSAPLNWIYAPKLDTTEMPFLIYDLSARLGNRLPALTPNIPIYQEYRVTEFHGSTSQALVFFYAPPRCLKVLDNTDDRLYPNKPDSIVAAMPLSRPELILPAATPSPSMPSFFGPEPAHDWCYYFEKIELAIQLQQWEQAAKLADQALNAKPALTRDNATELTPLIIAYARTARYDQARQLTLTAIQLSDKLVGSLCDTWYGLNRQISVDPAFQSAYASLSQEIQCPQP